MRKYTKALLCSVTTEEREKILGFMAFHNCLHHAASMYSMLCEKQIAGNVGGGSYISFKVIS
jgi:predicted RNA-binding protein (virulence factor B family)